MRSSEHRPSAALWAIGAFLALLITGATAWMLAWESPEAANVADSERPAEPN